MTQMDRKARLAALAARAGRSKTENEGESIIDSTTNVQEQSSQKNEEDVLKEPKKIQFRNYTPKDGTLEGGSSNNKNDNKREESPISISDKLESLAKRRKINEKETSTEKTALEKALLQAKVEAAIATRSVKSNPLQQTIATAPKKVNWDLKRDISKKLDRLERRTQKAIVELLRVRLEKEAEEGDDGDDEGDDLD